MELKFVVLVSIYFKVWLEKRGCRPHKLLILFYLKATLVDKSVFVIHVKSYKLQRQFMLRSRERGNIQLLNGMCREAQECIRHD